MTLCTLDWLIIAGFMAFTLLVGVLVSKRAGGSSSEFFLSGRHMPWWLLGMSMVATTFSASTPNLVADIVRQNGVAGNWVWWAFLLTGMMTVFVYAKLWRRSGIVTDIEFYELRYSGRSAAFLRGFRAIYLGVLFNVFVMAAATLAAIKIAGVMIGSSPTETVVVAGLVTVIYSMMGGLTSVLLTDFVLFIVSMGGAIAAAVYIINLESIGGLSGLLANENVQSKMSMFPALDDTDLLISVFLIPLFVQWWSTWYPGAEPGGGGYIAQRMLAAKNETHATAATLFFNVAHYALRPWPWILVALCSLVVYPTLDSLQAAFPEMGSSIVKHDLAYPAMIKLLPPGLLGLVLASLVAAYMSTISTHLNWGSSYVVNDFYKRFIHPAASEKRLVLVGRISTLLLMVFASIIALSLSNAAQVFHMILQIGAGTGLLFILRWFWWRINAYSEIAAMLGAIIVAVAFEVAGNYELFGIQGISSGTKLVLGVATTTAIWLVVTLLTRPTNEDTLRRFYRLIRPGGPGWRAIVGRAMLENDPLESENTRWNVPLEILCMLIGCVMVYCALFATGYWIYGRYLTAAILTGVAILSAGLLMRMWNRLNRVHPH